MSKKQIPESWSECPLKDLVKNKLTYGVLKPGNPSKDGIPMLRIEDLKFGYPQKSNLLKISKSLSDEYKRSIVQTGDVLLSVVGTLGKVIVARKDLEGINVSRAISVIRPKDVLSAEFFAYYINSPVALEWIKKRSLGSAQKVLNLGTLDELAVPLLPQSEQARIISKIESTQEKVKTIESCVSKAEELIEKYRESLLQKAFRGELVPQDPNDEPASKLIERIRAERAEVTDGKKKKKDELLPIKSDEIPFNIPRSWEWIRLGEIAIDLNQGINTTVEKIRYVDSGYEILQANNITSKGIIKEQPRFISEKDYKRTSDRCKPAIGDVLYTNIGTIGNSAVNHLKDHAIAWNVLRIVPERRIVSSEWLSIWLRSHVGKQLTKKLSTKSTMEFISGKNIRLLPIPIPPYNHQIAIQDLLATCESEIALVNEIVTSTNTLIIKLLDSILTSAFSGRLVSQDPSEGTGHELLAKIKSEQPQATEPKAVKKTAAPVKKKRAKK